MGWTPIVKRRGADPVAPNLDDYERVCAAFTWAGARAALHGLPAGRGLNIAHEAVDRHAAGARADHVAIRWLGKRGEVREYTYRQLRELTNRFANVLDGLGVRRGERVYALAGRIPELYVAALGTLKHGSVFCPLFSAFGPLRGDVGFRDQLDLDSMDVLNFVVGLHAALGVDIPESDYGKLPTLDACVDYLDARSRG